MLLFLFSLTLTKTHKTRLFFLDELRAYAIIKFRGRFICVKWGFKMGKTLDTKYGMDFDTFFNIIDNMYDEIFIVDNNYKLVYVNKACQRHYGCDQKDMIGKTTLDFDREKWWEPSFMPLLYKNKKAYGARQKIFNGQEVTSLATPIFDENDNVQYVVLNVHDNINEIDLYSNNPLESKEFFAEERPVLVYKSQEMKEVHDLASKISSIDTTSIITGETGVGKTLLAKHMHQLSPRADKPFISVNCASLPSELLEAELFGYAKGAFTGANSEGKQGLFELANHGTILLDEISELSLSAQAKILHVCQEKEFLPVCGTTPIQVDVKIIAATNKSLSDLVESGQFREDLYYRLNVVEIYIPPLRRRREDIPVFVYHFLNEFSKKYKLTRNITDRAIEVLVNYDWKGNVRELRHVVERMVVTSDSFVIDIRQLPKSLFGIIDAKDQYMSENIYSFDEKIEAYEAYLIRNAFEKHKSSRKVAQALSISQSKANTLIRKYVEK